MNTLTGCDVGHGTRNRSVEDLPVDVFEDVHEYPVAMATHKAVEVYKRLVVRLSFRGSISHVSQSSNRNPPDLVIAGKPSP